MWEEEDDHDHREEEEDEEEDGRGGQVKLRHHCGVHHQQAPAQTAATYGYRDDAALWIRIRIVSVFKSFVDPNPHM